MSAADAVSVSGCFRDGLRGAAQAGQRRQLRSAGAEDGPAGSPGRGAEMVARVLPRAHSTDAVSASHHGRARRRGQRARGLLQGTRQASILGPRALPWPAALAATLAGALVLSFAYPERNWWWCAPVGILLLLGALRGARPGFGALVGGVGGLTFYLVHVSWTSLFLGPVPWIALSALMGAWWAVGGAGIAWAYRRVWGASGGPSLASVDVVATLPASAGVFAEYRGSTVGSRAKRRHPRVRPLRRLRRMVLPGRAGSVRLGLVPLAVASMWSARETLSSLWPYGGFAWGRVAQSQADSPLGPLVAWLGFAGLGFVIVWACAALLELAALPLPGLVFERQARMPGHRIRRGSARAGGADARASARRRASTWRGSRDSGGARTRPEQVSVAGFGAAPAAAAGEHRGSFGARGGAAGAAASARRRASILRDTAQPGAAGAAAAAGRRASILLGPVRAGAGWQLAARTAGALAGAALLVCWPHWQTATSGSVRILAVQGDTPGASYFVPAAPGEVLRAHINETLRALDTAGPVDLVLWPEGSVDVSPFDDESVADALTAVSQAADAPLLVNFVTRTGSFDDPATEYFNAQVLWADGGPAGEYDKAHPIPFGEYVPNRDFFMALAPDLIGLVKRGYTPGTRPNTLTIDAARYGIFICYDIVDDALVRQAVGQNAEVLLAPTNNADFGRTEESAQQLATAKLRALETGRPLVQTSTVGWSAAFAADGTELAALDWYTPGAYVVTVPRAQGSTPAIILGPALDLFVGILGPALALASRTRSSARVIEHARDLHLQRSLS